MTVRRRPSCSLVAPDELQFRRGRAESSFIIRAARAVVFPLPVLDRKDLHDGERSAPGSDTVTILSAPIAFTSTAQPGGL